MTPTTEQVLQAAMELPEDERWELVEALLDATAPIDGPPFAPEWLDEIRRRSAEVDAGTVEFAPWDVVRERVRRGIEGRSRD